MSGVSERGEADEVDEPVAGDGFAIGRRPGGKSVLDELVTAIYGVLGRDLAAAYLYGSCVSGGFEPGVSDPRWPDRVVPPIGRAPALLSA